MSNRDSPSTMATNSTVSTVRQIAQSTGIVMASVLASRVLGFLREWMVAREVGSNAITDAYYAAFTLPDFLNYLVAGGSLSLIFIPVFTKYLAEDREDQAWHVFSTVITFMGLVLVGFVAAAEILAPRLVSIIAPGFGPAQKARVVFLTRLMLPAQFFFYQGGVLSAVQYARAQFVTPSLASIVYNLGIILGGVLLSPRIGITGFAVGVLAGAFAGSFLLQIYGAVRAGARFRPNLNLRHPGFRLFLKLAIPIMLALSLTFTDDWIIRWFGSFLAPASITWLSYAKNLMRVPLGVVGQAVGVASFPFLAQLYSERKFEELNSTLNSTIRALLLMLLPISALTIAESEPLVYLVFSHTRLHGPDFHATASILALFSIGMFGWGVQNLLARAFYAARDTLTPAAVGTALTLLNLPVYWVLARLARHLGLAIASSLGIIAYTVALFVILKRRTQNPGARGLVFFSLRMASASALGAIGCFEIMRWLEARVAWRTTHGAFFVLVTASTAGLVLMGVLARALGIVELEGLTRKVQRLASLFA